jgi:hypothetical protein
MMEALRLRPSVHRLELVGCVKITAKFEKDILAVRPFFDLVRNTEGATAVLQRKSKYFKGAKQKDSGSWRTA